MRRIGVMDLHHAARAVAVRDFDFAAELCWRAHVADKYVKHFSRLHPHWGDGSLRAASVGEHQAEDVPTDALLRGYHAVIESLIRRDHANFPFGGTGRVCVRLQDAK